MATLEQVVTELQDLNKIESREVAATLEVSANLEKLIDAFSALSTQFNDYFDWSKKEALLDKREEEIDQQTPTAPGQTPTNDGGDDKPQKIETPDNPFGWIGSMLGLAGSLVLGFVEGFVSQVRAITKALNLGVTKTLGGVTEKITQIFRSIRSYVGMVANTISSMVKGGVRIIRSYVGMVKESIKAVLGLGDDIARVTQGIRSAFSSIKTGGGFLKPIMDTVKSVMGFMKGMSGVFRALGNVLGKLVLPVTIIMGIFDGITGFIDGFANESGNMLQKVLAGLYGAVEEIVANLIFLPLDLLKGAVSWIMDAIGLDFISDMLDSFSFEDIFRGLFSAITDAVIHPVETLKKLWAGITDWVSKKVKMLNPLNWFGGDEEEQVEQVKKEQKDDFDKIVASSSELLDDGEYDSTPAPAAPAVVRRDRRGRVIDNAPAETAAPIKVTRATRRRGATIGDAPAAPTKVNTVTGKRGMVIGASSSPLLDDGEYDATPVVQSPEIVAEAMNLDYTDELTQVKEMLSDLFTPVVDAFKSVKEFMSNIIPLDKIQSALTNLFAEIGIPRVEFTIPFIDKTVGFGPFYPFAPSAGADGSNVSVIDTQQKITTDDTSKTFTDRSSSIQNVEQGSNFSYTTSENTESIRTDAEKKDITTTQQVNAMFDYNTGKGTVSLETYKSVDNLMTDQFSEIENSIKEYEVGPVAIGQVRRMIDDGATPEQIREFLEYNEKSISEKVSSFFGNLTSSAVESVSSIFGSESSNTDQISQSSDREVIESAMVSETSKLQEKRAEESNAAVSAPIIAPSTTTSVVNNQTVNAGPMPSAMDRSDRTDRRGAFRGRG